MLNTQKDVFNTQKNKCMTMPELNTDSFDPKQRFKDKFKFIVTEINKSLKSHSNLQIEFETWDVLVNNIRNNPDHRLYLDILKQIWPKEPFRVEKLKDEEMIFTGESIELLKIKIQSEMEQGGRYKIEYYVYFDIQRKDTTCACSIQ